MSDAPPRHRAIVAGHGDFAAGLVSAVEQITGRGNAFIAVTARDLSAADLEAMLRKVVQDAGISVVFTDLQAGSCTMAARKMARDRDELVLIVGVNLPMLIDFVFADGVSDAEAALHAFERGRSAMAMVSGGGGRA